MQQEASDLTSIIDRHPQEKKAGTKIFSLVGKINNTGLVEIPMGMTLREIIFDIGGGIPDGKEFKTVQTGGHFRRTKKSSCFRPKQMHQMRCLL